MAHLLSRSITSASVAPLPNPSPLPLKNNGGNKMLNLRCAILPPNCLGNRLSYSKLKWKAERRDRNRRVVVRCEAAVAEKEAPETVGETREYQAEVIFFFWVILWVWNLELSSPKLGVSLFCTFLSLNFPGLKGELSVRLFTYVNLNDWIWMLESGYEVWILILKICLFCF